jgi:uncharacterized protein (TIGR03086 family)
VGQADRPVIALVLIWLQYRVMQNLLDLFSKGQHQFGMRVHRITSEQWDAATPCSDWTVRQLVDHLIDEQRWVPPLVAGRSLAQAQAVVDSPQVGDDPVAHWDAAAEASRIAFAEPGALEREVTLSRGQTPATEYLSDLILDLAVHSWDLGQAVGISDPLPADLISHAAGIVRDVDLSSTGAFDPPVSVSPDASDEDRLIAATGRDPR